jgi:hypothetical protein
VGGFVVVVFRLGSGCGFGWGCGFGCGSGSGWGFGAGFGAGAGVGLLFATRAGVELGVVAGGVVGLVAAVVVVADGTTFEVGVRLVVDATSGVLSDVDAGTGGAVEPIATRVAIEPTAETGRTSLFGYRGELTGEPDCARPNPVSHSANATQRVTGQNNIAATPMAIPIQSHLRRPG